jgi:hypothetical protein
MNKNLRKAIKAAMLFVCLSFFQNETKAQAFDNGIFFQALARDSYFNPAKDRKIYVQASIIQSSITGTKVLVEEFQVTTDASGVFGISIGKGVRTGGTLSGLNSIDWSAGPYFLNLQISITPVAPVENWNYTKDWVDLGTTSFGTVPYALHAKTVVGFDTKLNVSDTIKMLSTYAKTSLVNTKLNTKDSITSYVTPTQLVAAKFDTTNLSNRINLKANATDVAINTANIATNTNDIATLNTNVATNTANIATNTNDITLKANIASLATVATSGSYNDLSDKPSLPIAATNILGGVKVGNNLAIDANGVLSSTAIPYTGATSAVNLGAYDLTVNGLRIGLGGGLISTNVVVGRSAMNNNTSGANNIAAGFEALKSNTTGYSNAAFGGAALTSNTTGFYNTALGKDALRTNTIGLENTGVGLSSLYSNAGASYNTAIGSSSLVGNTTGEYNTAVGRQAAGATTTGSNNVALGAGALNTNTIGSSNTAIGRSADVSANNISNASAIGYGAIVSASNSIQLGNVGVTNVKTNGTLTAGVVTYPNAHGTNGQVLTTIGSGALTWNTPTAISVGAMSSTSNSKGAVINSGVLTLTPADATNGGVITTGAQTFTGLKTFNSGINYIKFNSPVLDQSNPTAANSIGGNNVWQSFTAGSTGKLNSVEFKMTSPLNDHSAATYTIYIYSGEGLSGTLLGTGTAIVSGSSWSFVPFDLSGANINVVSGQQYTLYITTPILYWANLYVNISNSYSGGRASPLADWDLVFNTYVSPATLDSYLPLSGGTLTGNLSTTGTLTAGAVTFPSAHGSNGQVLSTTGSGTLTWTTVSGGGSGIPYTGATGSVNLGAYDLTTNTLTVGLGSGSQASNTVLGKSAMASNSSGGYSVAVGYEALKANTNGNSNTALGYQAMHSTTTGGGNIAIGMNSMLNNTIGQQNTAIGQSSLNNNSNASANVAIGNTAGAEITTGGYNTIIGTESARGLSTGSWNTILGRYVYSGNVSNNIIIGNGQGQIKAQHDGTNWTLTGGLTAGGVTYPSSNGTNGQVLTTNGSGVASWANATSVTMASIGSASNSNGATISSGTLSLTPADGTNGGIITTGSQTISGNKTFNGKVQVGSGSANTSAALDVQSTTQGFLPPRMTYAQKIAITSPVAGLVIWCSNCGASGELQVYNGTTWTNAIGGTASAKIAEVGDNYGGGIVTYIFQVGDPGYVAGETHGLVIASTDQSTGVFWGPNSVTGVTATTLGTGSNNTDAIVTSLGAGTYAAKICSDLVEGGYSDWYLPSKDELYKMFLNRDVNGVGRSARGYFSSSEYSGSLIWLGWMDDGNFTTWAGNCEACKSQLRYVRAFRNF